MTPSNFLTFQIATHIVFIRSYISSQHGGIDITKKMIYILIRCHIKIMQI